MPDQMPRTTIRPELADVPAALLAHDTGLTAERLRELFTFEDAYAGRPVARPAELA